jgi:hypothetical protein
MHKSKIVEDKIDVSCKEMHDNNYKINNSIFNDSKSNQDQNKFKDKRKRIPEPHKE